MDFVKEVTGNFYGNLDLSVVESASAVEATFFDLLFNQAKLQMGLEEPQSEQHSYNDKRHMSAVSSRDVKLNHLYAVVQRRSSAKAQLDLSFEITKRMQADHVFESFNLATGAARSI